MSETPDEEVLHGGRTSVVVRAGDTVSRQTGHWTPAVHALLAHLRSVGFADAPTVLGIDGRGREILTFVVGEVGNFDPGRLPRWFSTIDACRAIGDWLRRFHGAQRGFIPDPSLPWRMGPGRPLAAGEVVVHHDAGPYNTVRRPDGRLTVIDWDFCAPGDPSRTWLLCAGRGRRCGTTGQPSNAGSARSRPRHPRPVSAPLLMAMARAWRTGRVCCRHTGEDVCPRRWP